MASVEPDPGWPAGGLVGLFIGGLFGSTIGIAGFGTAIAGTLPIGILGAWLGYRHGRGVVEWMSRKDTNEVLRDVKEAATRALDGIVPDCTGPTSEQEREERINAIVIQLLFFQPRSAGVALPEIRLSHRAADDWSIGYVWGFEDAFLQWTGRGPDVDGFASMAMIFIELYGRKEGPELCGRAFRLQEKHHPCRAGGAHTFTDGLMAGGQDAVDWLTSQGNKVPLGWFEHLNEG